MINRDHTATDVAITVTAAITFVLFILYALLGDSCG